MPTESSRRCELAELVPDHVFGNEHFNVLLAVVNHKSRSDEFRNDGATSSQVVIG